METCNAPTYEGLLTFDKSACTRPLLAGMRAGTLVAEVQVSVPVALQQMFTQFILLGIQLKLFLCLTN
jgi:hypothetical protein